MSVLDSIPIISAARQEQQKQSLVKEFTDLYERSRRARGVTERQWYLNMAFYYGRQNVQFIRTSTAVTNYRLFVPPAPPWRVRLIINKIRPIIRTEIAKTTSQKPIFTVVPATSEDEDIYAARAAEQIFVSAYTSKELQTILQRAAWWRSVTGVGFLKVWWDPSGKDPINQEPGDICIERIRPFNIFVPNLLEEDIEKQPWVIHAFTLSPVDAQKAYNLPNRPSAKANVSNDLMEDSFLNMIGAKNTEQRQETLILECWIKKHPAFPNGGLITIVGDEIGQYLQQYPYAHGEYPFAKLDHVQTGAFYSDSVISDLVPLQREFNRTRSQLVENKNLMGRPRYMAARGSVEAQKITGEPGQVIFYEPGLTPPTPMEMPSMPNYVMDEIGELQNDMDDISGQHEITRGNTPPQVTAATAISFLQEQDDSKLSSTIESQEAAVRKVGRQYLALVNQYWATERLIRIIGSDSYFDAMQFKGADIKGTTINNDVRVESGSSLSTSKAAKSAIIMDLMKNGLIDPKDGLRRMEFGGVEKLYEDIELDIRQAQRENLKLGAGQGIGTNTWDNHQMHIEIHNRFRKTQQYEMLPPDRQTLFEAHVQQHMLTVNATLMQNQPLDPAANLRNNQQVAMQPQQPQLPPPSAQPGGMQ